jgi:C4-dicarboxylate-specific signal transduction histidine kinase
MSKEGIFKILIVDDSKFNQVTAKQILLDFEVESLILTASDGEEALEIIKEKTPDIVLLDIVMPKMDGVEVLRQLNKNDLLKKTKVAIITNLSDVSVLKTTYDLGATDFIRKPFEPVEFISRIKSIANTIKTEKELIKYINIFEIQNKKLIEYNKSLKETQFYLVQKEKLVAIGELAAGVAHEINNPLAYISSNINSLNTYVQKFLNFFIHFKKIGLDENDSFENAKNIYNQLLKENNIDFILEDITELLQDTKNGVQRVDKIVSSLRNFARASDEEAYEYIDIRNIIEDVLLILNNELKYNIIVTRQFEDNLPNVYVNKVQLEQVFVNLIVNAAYAIKNTKVNGNIILKTYSKDEYICIDVVDDGGGIPQENLNKIFNPFFTTKEIGSGTGLGLSISYDIIVNKHEGKIEVLSDKGTTTFTIMLRKAYLNEDV